MPKRLITVCPASQGVVEVTLWCTMRWDWTHCHIPLSLRWGRFIEPARRGNPWAHYQLEPGDYLLVGVSGLRPERVWRVSTEVVRVDPGGEVKPISSGGGWVVYGSEASWARECPRVIVDLLESLRQWRWPAGQYTEGEVEGALSGGVCGRAWLGVVEFLREVRNSLAGCGGFARINYLSLGAGQLEFELWGGGRTVFMSGNQWSLEVGVSGACSVVLRLRRQFSWVRLKVFGGGGLFLDAIEKFNVEATNLRGLALQLYAGPSARELSMRAYLYQGADHAPSPQ